MKQYNFFQVVVASFFSKDLYQDVAKNWRTSVLLCLLSVLALCWLFLCLYFQPIVSKEVTRQVEALAPQMPIITIKDGVASTPERKPYFIKDPTNNQVLAIIDTSGKYQTLPAGISMLLTSSTFYVTQQSKAEAFKAFSLDPTMNYIIQPGKIKYEITHFVSWLWLVLLPFFVLFSFIYRCVEALIYALIGKVFALICGVEITYTQVLKLAIVSLIPVIVITTIFQATYVRFPMMGCFYFLLAMGYLLFAVFANKQTAQTDVLP